ncbi:MAG: SidJ-related pseudokinase, partial [Desulfovermiculus sp.]
TMPSSFTAQYMNVRSCADTIASNPDWATAEDIESLRRTLCDPSHADQTCAHFLYQEAAMALARFVRTSSKSDLREQAWRILDTFTLETAGSASLAAAQALGSLPLRIQPPSQPDNVQAPVRPAELSDLVHKSRIQSPAYTQAGRSLLIHDHAAPDRILVLKMATTREQAQGLACEAWWMKYLADHHELLPGLHIPSPLNGCCRVNLNSISQLKALQPERIDPVCLPYLTRSEYFTYALAPEYRLDLSDFRQVLAQAACGLGRLSRQGIVHRAPIPLFHNRIQSGRRDDNGCYIWTRGGRLDRWFDSCLYPNFGLSGLRDFEHLEVWSGYPRHLFRDLGTQIMSLILTAGGWFRLKEPKLMGLTPQGLAVDARYLFDRTAFISLLETIVQGFSTGFLGRALNTDMIDCQKFVDPFIEGMGMDRHMTEIFRRQDQLAYDPESFHALLRAKALDPAVIQNCLPGEQDIILVTGPHLGEFNSRICIPELTSLTAVVAGTCIAEAYFQEQSMPGE